MEFTRKLVLLALSLLSALPCWAETVYRPSPAFISQFPKESLEAEQFLPERVPVSSDANRLLGTLVKPLSMTGSIPAEFVPASGNTFDLVPVLIEKSQVEIIKLGATLDSSMEEILPVSMEGKTYYRYFVHPLELERVQKEFPFVKRDPTAWQATPSSSTRSLFAQTSGGKPFVAKTSLQYLLAGVHRDIDKSMATRAVQSTAFYEAMMKATGGKIPHSEKTWTYFPETTAVGFKGKEAGFTIMRTLPADYGSTVYLPFYSLISQRSDGSRWIDELYSASGQKNKLEFVWKEIAKPLLDFHLLAHLENGMVTELHQQNALLRVDPATKKILGIGVRDMDGHSIDYLARKHLLHLPVPDGGLTHLASSTHGYAFARQMPMLGYEYLKDSILKNLFRYFLVPEDQRKLVGLANEYMLSRFNEKYAKVIGRTPQFLQLSEAFQKVYRAKSSPADLEFLVKESADFRKSTPLLGRLSKDAIFGYYRLKQLYFERTELPENASSLWADRRVDELLQKIQTEARGLVPDSALDHWVALQTQGEVGFQTKVALDKANEQTLTKMLEKVGNTNLSLQKRIEAVLDAKLVSAEEMRTLALEFSSQQEEKLRGAGLVKKLKPDFLDEGAMVKKIYARGMPHWYTFESFSINQFSKLLALPIQVVGISDLVNHADGYELPPREFLFHDELHSLAAVSAQEEALLKARIRPGSVEFYEKILERVRFTKRFMEWADGLEDPVEKRIVKALWFDAFHEQFAKKWPIHPHHQNYDVTPQSLAEYVKKNRPSEGKKLRLPTYFQQNPAERFVPGDFLAPGSKDQAKFTPDAIEKAFQELDGFSQKEIRALGAATNCGSLFSRFISRLVN